MECLIEEAWRYKLGEVAAAAAAAGPGDRDEDAAAVAPAPNAVAAASPANQPLSYTHLAMAVAKEPAFTFLAGALLPRPHARSVWW